MFFHKAQDAAMLQVGICRCQRIIVTCPAGISLSVGYNCICNFPLLAPLSLFAIAVSLHASLRHCQGLPSYLDLAQQQQLLAILRTDME